MERKRAVAFAIVHHANQYIITDGYSNRCGITSVVGSVGGKRGLIYILELHRTYKIPANIHVSGTLLESLAWYQPECLTLIRKMRDEGLIEIVGSAYSQNIMRFFDHAYNVNQLNEQLDLYQTHLGIEPGHIKSFWPPERVWDTALMAGVLRDSTLRNGGFDCVFIDDRLLLPVAGENSPRLLYDQNPESHPELFQACQILGGQGLVAVPIAGNLRRCIPPRDPRQQRGVDHQLRWVGSLEPDLHGGDFLALYADDMEKPAAVGWDPDGPSQFESFLRWLSESPWVNPVKVSDWLASSQLAEAKHIEAGTYMELAIQFEAGEAYEKWYFDSRWAPYREYFAWSESRAHCLSALGADPSLMELAEKHLLASSWETAWHTPVEGAHGDINSDGGPSGSSRTVASHSRHAAMIAEAGYWMTHKDDQSHCYLRDVDNDGEEELILKNRELYAVISPKGGGRLVALFNVGGDRGTMVVGNPTDDWNLKEQLHDYMDIPRNHPGAFADVAFEHDSYAVEIPDGEACAVLRNTVSASLAFDLIKEFHLELNTIRVEYILPRTLSSLDVEFGLSPDYLNLLRTGRAALSTYDSNGACGCRTNNIAVWVKPTDRESADWAEPYQSEFGHGRALRLSLRGKRCGVMMGIERLTPPGATQTTTATSMELQS